MNIEIERSRLFPVVNLVSSVVAKQRTMPILAHLYVRCEKGVLHICGTDIEVEISETITEVKGDDFSFTVSARKILDICRNLPENALILLKKEEDILHVNSGLGRYKLKTLDPEEFPRITVGDWEERFKIDQLSLKNVLNKTSFAMAIQDLRYYLNGILFELTNNNLRTTATDGHRLARTEIDIKLNINELRQIIVPRKAVMEIIRFLDPDDTTELTIEINKNHLKLTKGTTVLITKLVDGKFPEFKDVISDHLGRPLKLDKTTFLELLNRLAVLTSENYKGVKIHLETGVMRIMVHNLEHENAVEEIFLDYQGQKIVTGYNITYLIDAAKVVNHDNIELYIRETDGVCLCKQPDDPHSLWLVMPLKI